MTEGTFSENGFRVVADNALDLLTATHAAGQAGHTGPNGPVSALSSKPDLRPAETTGVETPRDAFDFR